MALLSLAEALTDFGKPAEEPLAFADASPRTMPAFDLPDEPLAPAAPDVDALVADAVAAAEAEVEARLREEMDATLAAERERHAAELENLRALSGEAAGAALAERLEVLEGRLLELTATVVSRVLGPVLTDDLVRRSVESLGGTIREALRDSGALRIRVRGPLSLCEALERRLGEKAEAIEFIETGGFDLSVEVDDSLYETRLAEWSASMSEALG